MKLADFKTTTDSHGGVCVKNLTMHRVPYLVDRVTCLAMNSIQCLQGNSVHAVNENDSGETGRHRGDRLQSLKETAKWGRKKEG